MNTNLKDKTAVITGANTGIGKEVAYLFAKEGTSVILTYFEGKESAEETIEKCKKLGSPNANLIYLNLTQEKSINDAFTQILEISKKIDILINSAGVILWNPLSKQSFADIDYQIMPNFTGTIKFTKKILPITKEVVVNVCSGASKIGYGNLSVYCATKFGIRGFTQAIAQEYPNLMFYVVNPDPTATKINDYVGRPPNEVADVIINCANKEYDVKSGSDIDVWEVAKSKKKQEDYS